MKKFFLFLKLIFVLTIAGSIGVGSYLVLQNKDFNVTLSNFLLNFSDSSPNTQQNSDQDKVPIKDLENDLNLVIYNQNLLERNIEIIYPKYSMVIESNKDIELKDDTNFKKLYYSGEFDSKKVYVLELQNIGDGVSKRSVSIGNKQSTVSFVVNINKKPSGVSSLVESNLDWPNYKYYPYPNNLLAVVDKEYKIPFEYEPNDLVNLYEAPYLLYTNNSQMFLRKEAADALKSMLNDYKKYSGKNLVIASAYRSISNQFELFSYWVSQLGIDEAVRVSAKPGYSEHHLGTVVDFINSDSGLQLTEKFAETDAYAWLLQNAHKYGFVLSYPKDKEEITGYKFEPWHWRYLGIENAQNFKESNLTLNQWLKEKIKI